MHDPVTIAVAGFGLGFLHSLEPDPLAAISTLVGRTPEQARTEFFKGAAWAAGHVVSLGAFGAAALFLATSQLSTATRPFGSEPLVAVSSSSRRSALLRTLIAFRLGTLRS
jgi:high-affinity nickel permease